uniref:Uncharacterized protein n=1 Tax=Setaria italica TaxID=4555 RepID=K3YTX6_SETIT
MSREHVPKTHDDAMGFVLKARLKSSSSIGHPARARADAEPRRRPVPRAARVRAVSGECAAVLARTRRVPGEPAAGAAPAVRRRGRHRRRGSRLGACRPRRGHRRVHLRRLLRHAAGESTGRRHVGVGRRRPGGGALVRRHCVVRRVRLPLRGGHPALEPVEAQAGLLVLLPLPLPLLVRVGVGKRPFPARGGVVAAGALGPGVLQGAAAPVPAAGGRRAPPSAAVDVVAAAEPAPAPAPLLQKQQVRCHLAVVAGVVVTAAHRRQVEARVVVMACCSRQGQGGAAGRGWRGRRREEEEREVGEAARPDAGLGADEGLHAAHGEVDLPPHLVAAHQRLQPH